MGVCLAERPAVRQAAGKSLACLLMLQGWCVNGIAGTARRPLTPTVPSHAGLITGGGVEETEGEGGKGKSQMCESESKRRREICMYVKERDICERDETDLRTWGGRERVREK